MSDDDIEDDELDDVETSDDTDDGDLPDSDEVVEPTVKPRKKAAEDDLLEGLSLEAKAREREMLARQMEEFMARGGKIQQIDDHVIGDPPKKPDGKYGSRPI